MMWIGEKIHGRECVLMLIAGECLYNTTNQLAKTLRQFCKRPLLVRNRATQVNTLSLIDRNLLVLGGLFRIKLATYVNKYHGQIRIKR